MWLKRREQGGEAKREEVEEEKAEDDEEKEEEDCTGSIEYVDPFLHVAEEQRVVESAHHITPHFCDFQHLTELVSITRKKVKKTKAFEFFGFLVSHLYNLVVSLKNERENEMGLRGARGLDKTRGGEIGYSYLKAFDK